MRVYRYSLEVSHQFQVTLTGKGMMLLFLVSKKKCVDIFQTTIKNKNKFTEELSSE